jgi:hypothetical protein
MPAEPGRTVLGPPRASPLRSRPPAPTEDPPAGAEVEGWICSGGARRVDQPARSSPPQVGVR